MPRNMCIWRHKLCNAKMGVGPTFTWSSEAWSTGSRWFGQLLSDCPCLLPSPIPWAILQHIPTTASPPQVEAMQLEAALSIVQAAGYHMVLGLVEGEEEGKGEGWQAGQGI